jgi:hypothetical protein
MKLAIFIEDLILVSDWLISKNIFSSETAFPSELKFGRKHLSLIKSGEVGNFFALFNEVAQFLSKSEVLVALSVFSSPYFFHQ